MICSGCTIGYAIDVLISETYLKLICLKLLINSLLTLHEVMFKKQTIRTPNSSKGHYLSHHHP